MGRALWLADTLRAAGLVVHEVDGWQTRGSSTFDPRWQVFHHTASHAGSDHPSLNICTYGRSDLAGPLCNVLVARNGDCWVVASGRANHAGTGRYPDGTTGNSLSIGWECENNGTGEPWPDAQLEAIAVGQAAVACHLGQPATSIIYHRTFAPGRKIDPAGPGIPQDVTVWQARVAATMTGEPDMPLNDADLFTIGVIVKQCLADTGLATLSEKEKRRAQKLRARLQRIEVELDAQQD